MPDFDTLQPNEQRKFLLNLLAEHASGAVLEGNTLHYTSQALHVSLEFGQVQSRENQFRVQLLFILKHDWFDEDFVNPCASIGNSLQKAMENCTVEFAETVLQPVLDSLANQGSETISSEIIHETHVFHIPEKKLQIHKGNGKTPDLWEIIKHKLPEYLGTKKAYWIQLFSADMGQRRFCEAKINGIVYPDLTDVLYSELFSRKKREISIDKLFVLLIQDESTFQPCPFTKQNVGDLAYLALDKLKDASDENSRQKAFQKIHQFSPDYSIAVELVAFLPEIMAHAIVSFRDNDALIPVFNYGKPEFELKKSQVRSFGYMTDAVEQYLRKYHPSKEEVYNILRISGKFEVLTRAMQDKGIKAEDLRLSQLVYFVNDNYHVW
ncbi:MAG: hypothetical protein IKP69_05030 [Oscillospiraceae bacterium]|nr:hypothetical protein [Oscillospiraceae bacterium]